MKILVVDDDEVTRKLLKEVLEKEGYSVRLASSGKEALLFLKKDPYPILLSDIKMAEMDGMAVLKQAQKINTRTAVILMTGFGSMEGAIEAIQEGAFDYVSKPFKMEQLKTLILRAKKHLESLESRESLELLGRQNRGFEFAPHSIIGRSPQIVEVYKTVARASLSQSPVLIQGESGTGKKLMARAIHKNSQRRTQAFVYLNSKDLIHTDLEAEIKKNFEQAGGGTLFLDEIGDSSSFFQLKLLHFLEINETKVKVRVISSASKNLEIGVKFGKMREDLFYKLKVIFIELPPLRERTEDIAPLCEYFVARSSEKNKKQVSHISEEALARFLKYSWPGNIRELEHVIERAVALSNTKILFPEDFPDVVELKKPSQDLTPSSLEQMEKAHILKVLQEVSFNKSKASEILGIDRVTLYRKAERFGIDLKGRGAGSGI